MSAPNAERPRSANATIVGQLLEAYRQQDRPTAERLLAEELEFTSPQDDHIGRAEYFDRCFPTADRFRSQDVIYLTDLDKDHVLLGYEYVLASGETYRNTEILTVRDGRITEIQVFFGGSVR